MAAAGTLAVMSRMSVPPIAPAVAVELKPVMLTNSTPGVVLVTDSVPLMPAANATLLIVR